ncbi:hypothetical protein [Microbulbifer litoralis]|uniref:hypothetical protein n=1 Tax=Microbulbifer litoralis TaxID=2933965 RepID=UPI002028344A|nr:hypothetical protein [Microbulbifer sp. GX H0434]
MDYSRLAALAAFLLPHAASADEFCRDISLGYTSGDIDGHVQAPFSRYPDSTPLRANFSEQGYDGFHQLNFSAGYNYGRNRFRLDYDRTRLGDNRADIPLSSLADEITAPVPVVVSSRLDLYRVGYERLFDMELFGRPLTLAPGAELAILDFDHRQRLDPDAIPTVTPVEDLDTIDFGDAFYDGVPSGIFDGDPGFVIAVPTEIDRSYTETGIRLGGEAKYRLSERFSLTAELYDSIPVDGRPEVFTGLIGLRLEVFATDSVALDLELRGGRETIEYEDHPADDLRAEYRDLVEGRIRLRF